MATDIDICNLALAHLGEDSITSLSDGTPRAIACNLHYAVTRDEVLRSHRWNFAIARIATVDYDEPEFEWTAKFELPTDCLRVLEFNGNESTETDREFVIEGRWLFSNSTTANIVYVKRETDTTLYDPIFVKALALKLAVALSESIRGTTGKTAELLAAYERYTAPLARRVDANEGKRRKGMLPFLAGSTFLDYREGEF